MNESSRNISDRGLCDRISQIRVELTGVRGKASFARQLGISPTTYQTYEAGRVPPADVLVHIADLAQVDLRWLLTGETADGPDLPAGHPALQRAAKLLASCPQAAAPLAAFVALLSETMKFPGAQDTTATAPATQTPAAEAQVGPAADGSAETTDSELHDAIPILGRSAAGVPQFWSAADSTSGLTTLRELIDRHAGRTRRRAAQATAIGERGEDDQSVRIVTLTSPEGREPAEFLVAGSLRKRYLDAFALRVDGESMAPDIRHGDIVVLSPSVAAEEGFAAVAQLTGQIGVTCKLLRRQDDTVHLVPINEQFPPRMYPTDQLEWALRVLARVRSAS